MLILRNIPTLLLLLIVYNVMMFTGQVSALEEALIVITMMSGATLSLTGNVLFILLGLFFLYVEIFKATRTDKTSMIEQSLSMMLFVVFLVEFLLVKSAGTATFLVLTFIQLLDVMAGFTVTVSTARRDLNLGG